MNHWSVPNQTSGTKFDARLSVILGVVLIVPFSANPALANINANQCPTEVTTAPILNQSVTTAQAPSNTAPLPPPQVIAKPQDFENSSSQTAHTGYPKWRDFPPPPEHVTSDKEIKTGVETLSNSRHNLIESSKNIVWTLNNPQGFANNAYARIKTVYLSPGLHYSCTDAIRFAIAKQKAATPPPPSAVGQGLQTPNIK